MVADFSGYATKNGLKCSDGRIIDADAFRDNDGQKVPLVWQHQHNENTNVLGHAMLENRDDGVYAYGFFNDTESGQNAKQLVQHGDITALSIYANKLVQRGPNVIHGAIREVSLVFTGANPGAHIDNVELTHGDNVHTLDDEAVLYTGLEFGIAHSEEGNTVADSDMTVKDVIESMTDEQRSVTEFLVGNALSGETADEDESVSHADSDEDEEDIDGETAKDVFNSMSKEQQNVVYFMIGEALKGDESEEDEEDDEDPKPKDDSMAQSGLDEESLQHSINSAVQEGLSNMTHVFAKNSAPAAERATLTHSQIETIVNDGIKMGSFKESVLAHAEDYGITDIELLFPDAKTVGDTPELIARQAEWVPKVLGATKHAPFARIKSLVADLTAAEARAKGYITGSKKTEEVIKMLRRTTGPTTVYKKQKLDRDDILDITDFDVITWLKWEIRFMLNEELARAILVGDGRSSVSPDKIKDPEGAKDGVGIRSIVNDDDLYAHKVILEANISPEAVIESVSRARSHYRGSGNPTWYTTDKNLTDLLLLKDKMGRRLYGTEAELAAALRVKEIVSVEVLEEYADVLGIMVNLVDYTVGSNRGGELSFFEDFDIDFNQNKYLLETRVSGALTKPKSAVVVTRAQGTMVRATAPSFDGETNTITIPTVTGVEYLIDSEVVTGAVEILEDTTVEAQAAADHYLEANSTRNWTFSFTEV